MKLGLKQFMNAKHCFLNVARSQATALRRAQCGPLAKTVGTAAQWLCLGSVLCLMLTGCNRSGPANGQAGVAYTEDEEGNLVPVDETSSSSAGTAAPKSLASQQPAGAEEEWLSKFELIERSGKLVSSDSLKGEPYVASFFFSTCPSICLRQNDKVQQLQERFQGQPVKFVSISCDPEVDRPAVLSQYADKFNADKEQWLFLTGDMGYITRVGGEMFGLSVMRRFHAEKFILVDAEGNNVNYYTWTEPGQWQALIEDLEKLIAAGGTFPEEAPSEE